jgi:mannose-6-phosphate isomerase-like protein (cupin superfamily)
MEQNSDSESDIRRVVEHVFPHCTFESIEKFVALLHAPASDIVTSAERILEKPYGLNHILRLDDRHGASYVILYPGRSTSLHVHRVRCEFFVVRTGEIELICGETSSILSKGRHGQSTPQVPHRLHNKSGERVEIIEMFSPFLLDDKVRLWDSYGRQLGAVGATQ